MKERKHTGYICLSSLTMWLKPNLRYSTKTIVAPTAQEVWQLTGLSQPLKASFLLFLYSSSYFLYFLEFELNWYLKCLKKIIHLILTIDNCGANLVATGAVGWGWARGWGWGRGSGWFCSMAFFAVPAAAGCSNTLCAGPVETVGCLRQPKKKKNIS